MTVRLESTQTEFTDVRSPCGRTGCVTIYTGDNCAFCDGALETLREALSDFGISFSVISEINISSCVSCAGEIPGILTLPTIRVCDSLISGMPDIDEARSRLMEALLKGCFPI
ncbi:MAG: glutaredoxin family protein [Candidatus Thorarchaeota archaeon]